jgi:hypothetical protein
VKKAGKGSASGIGVFLEEEVEGGGAFHEKEE